MRNCKILLLAWGLLGGAGSGNSFAIDKEETGFLDRIFKNAEGKESKYVLFMPHDYKGDKAYPLILFLHGAGETGTDGHKQVQVGLGPAMKKREKTFGFIAVFPQAQSRISTSQAGPVALPLGGRGKATRAFGTEVGTVMVRFGRTSSTKKSRTPKATSARNPRLGCSPASCRSRRSADFSQPTSG